MRASAADQANDAMVDRMIGQGMLWSPPLIAAFRSTPRHCFLDRVFIYQRKHDRWRAVVTQPPEGDELLRLVYADRALITKVHRPTSGGPDVPVSSSSQPSLMAQMLEDLRIRPGQRVLEIGAGTGYNAALLAQVAEPVFSIDVDRQVVEEATEHLRRFPDRHVEFRHGDGREGLPEEGPFDRIMVTAATPDLEPAWLRQTVDGGLVLAPLVLASGLAYIARGSVCAGVFEGRLTRTAWFLPLRGEQELGRNQDAIALPLISSTTLAAPWADWIDSRRARLGWLSFLQAFAFFAWLRGSQIAYGTLRDGETAYGLRDGGGEALCWASSKDWTVTGDAGREWAEHLWRAFLDAGAPWPTEFRLRAGLGPLPEPNGRECAIRRGTFCWQTWELIEPRDRPGGIEG
ncbi:MAG TPA: methyltransferase domain-containing protein [Gemmataceae bacterium]